MFETDFEKFGFSVLVAILGINIATMVSIRKFINSMKQKGTGTGTDESSKNAAYEEPLQVSTSLHTTNEIPSTMENVLLSSKMEPLSTHVSVRSSHSSVLGTSLPRVIIDTAQIEEKILSRI